MKHYIILFGFLLLFSSCSSFKYQIAQVSSSDDKVLTFENEELKLTFDFWDEGGQLYFEITNLTIEPIFIDWEHSNFVFNDYAYDYFANETNVKSLGVYSDLTRIYTTSGEITKRGYENINTRITREQKTAQIPPQSKLRTKVVGLGFPYFKTKEDLSFTEENSLLTFRTYLGYATKKNLDDVEKLKYIDKRFYVESVKNSKASIVESSASPDKFFTRSAYDNDKNKTLGCILGVLGSTAALAILAALLPEQ